MSHELTVQHLDGDTFAIDIRGHRVFVDQPIADGGTDTAPTPTELFIAGLASCIGFYARRYLARHGFATEGLAVAAAYDISGRPARVTDIRVQLTPPPTLPDDRRAAFLAVASHCTVHNTLDDAPKVNIQLV